ncbi:gliding motility-associated C-terminal domain-containing protein [Chitinophaga pinensis]|uniref:Gliding motility-associated C-terminal domain-containing protein n=1 Tax=Chitinophaga pinensis TaxID=79329 RepID=A0A5C6LPJ6_9BACT|nr:gliding motility-associated C-terminal domain-containing protein [Chitinophaga pinensis]TWV99374.1 gliding motility-associated C-terminal domain-containing protein [Chitinophaga pinensis]
MGPHHIYEVNGTPITSAGLPNLSAGNYLTTIVDANSCRVDGTVTLNNIVIPPLRITNNDTTIVLGEKINLYAVNAINYTWIPDDGLSCASCPLLTVQPSETTTYIVFTSGPNCVKSDTVTVFVDKRHSLFVPTAFSPNKDGQNDVFRVKGQGIASFNMHVYNRWGELIFRSDDYRRGWDGTYIEKLQPAGSYVYRIEYTFFGETEKVYQQKGAITLVR